MTPLDVIRRKRDGAALTGEEIALFIDGLTSGAVGDAQAAAFSMAVCTRGMTREERVALTLAMRDSGEVMRWDLPGPVVDKHSTGGVGDNVSLVLAPALAACGAYVPMISGRGLGHTGGTLDKLEAIPGYDTAPDPERFRKAVAREGCAIIGQTGDLAPADKRLYAVRDVTGTVESVDLITASILSKKLAAGLDALVLDVKCGSGAFMATLAEADELARSLVAVANGAGCRTAALMTDMNEPLASAAGNALEVANACAFLTGHEVDGRLWDVTVALGGEALALAGLAPDAEAGAAQIGDALQSGGATERFASMVAALGGPADFIERWVDYLPAAPVIRDATAPRDGFVAAIDGRALGEAVIALGGGRRQVSDQIDPAVGFDRIAGLGAVVAVGDPLARVHAATDAAADAAVAALQACYGIVEAPQPEADLIAARIGEDAP
ncbi:MAG: thymidine phosphorylase [Pseudomonadota bacterium]